MLARLVWCGLRCGFRCGCGLLCVYVGDTSNRWLFPPPLGAYRHHRATGAPVRHPVSCEAVARWLYFYCFISVTRVLRLSQV